MGIATINPTTGETLKTFEELSRGMLLQKIHEAEEAFHKFRKTSFDERAQWFTRMATILETEKRELGALMTLEMGKTLVSAVQEAEKCAWVCRYYGENAKGFLSDEAVQTNATVSFVRYEPLGPILAIMPWNFPFWQLMRFAVPAVMAGNVILLKHAPNVPQCALKIEELFDKAGFPPGVLQALLVEAAQVPSILSDARVKAVTLTGSVAAGRSVAGFAGSVIKKSVLELGGSDPFIVMPSADLAEATSVAVTARTINSGQSCIAAKRFIIHEEVYDEFTKGFVDRMKRLTVGDPLLPSTDIGPIARADLLEKLDAQVQASVKMGSRILLGGKKVDRPGFFYLPTVLADIPGNAPAFSEELFGPVASLFPVRTVDDAIKMANGTQFGLGSSVWTNDPAEQSRFIDELEAGAVFINGMVASDPRLPFGGVKSSGYGRELGKHGIREFTNIKTVWIKKSGE